MRVDRVLGVVVGVLLFAGVSQADTLLHLTPVPPQAVVSSVSVIYSAVTDNFYADGVVTDVNPAVPLPNPMTGQFELKAKINDLGVASSGSLKVYAGPYNNNPLFMSGTLVAFGSGPEDRFEFLFLSDGTGSLAPAGWLIGVQLFALGNPIPQFSDPTFGSSFTSNTQYGLYKADVFAIIPTPTAALAGLGLMGGLAGLGFIRRLRSDGV